MATGEPLRLLQGTVQQQFTASNRPGPSVLLSLLVRSNTPLSSPALVTLTFIPPPLVLSLSLLLSFIASCSPFGPHPPPCVLPASASPLIHGV